jgi:hypothetical protein
MNGYDLSRNFWNWAFDNPEKISPNHAAIYFFAVEHCNRLGGKEKFGFPSQMTMDAIGIRKHQTYIRYFNELVDYGFFKLIEKSRNQYSANIISLIYAMPEKDKALDKAIIKHRAKQTQSNGQSTGQSMDSIVKPINKGTKETIYKSFDHLSLSKNEFTKLSQSYTKEQIDDMLLSIENYKGNKNYKSLYLTLIKWLKKEYPKANNSETKTYTFKIGFTTYRNKTEKVYNEFLKDYGNELELL